MSAASLRWTVIDAWNIARRDLLRWIATPSRIAAEVGFSVVFILLFGYVFGSGMSVPGGGDYIQFLMPGLFVQFAAFGIGATMQEIASDAQKGITDRFRSMPIAPSAVVAGRSIADMVNAVISLAVTLLVAILLGWRPNGSAGEFVAAIGLLLLLRFAFLWVGIFLGLIAPNPESVQTLWSLLFPVTMLTSAFVSPELMPSVLGFIAEWNPLSSSINATRELFGSPGIPASGTSWVADHALLLSVLWPVVLVATFLPLSVRRYQRLGR